jgi:hypothetical protein
VAAVSLNDKGRPLHLKLSLVSGVTSQAIIQRAKAALAPDTFVSSDGLGGFAAVADAGCRHVRVVVVGSLKPRNLPQFKWVNTVLGNLKTTLAGAFHSLKYRKYAGHYLAGRPVAMGRHLTQNEMAG